MDVLPQEIIDKIAAHVHDDRNDFPTHSTTSPRQPAHSRVAPACISRRWKYAFERHSFRALRIQSNEMETFDAILRAERRNHLQSLELTIILPPCSEDTTHLFEQESDREANDEAFSTAFHHLFRILSTWNLSEASKAVLCLYLRDIICPTDPDPEIWAPGTAKRHRYSYLCLQRAEDLPLVPIISGFDMRMHQGSSRRHITPRTGIELLARMPMVNWAMLDLPDSEDRYPNLRRRNRDDLASVLRSQSLPSSLDEDLGLHVASYAGANQTWPPANLLTHDGRPDPVSSAIWEASSKLNGLRTLKIEGTFDHSLLWPGLLTTSRLSSISHTVPVPFWQNITIMVIVFDPRTPSGEWYFRAPDGIDIHDCPFLDPSQPGVEFDNEINIDVTETEMPPGYNLPGSQGSAALSDFDWNSDCLDRGWAPVWVFRLVPEEHVLFPLIEAWARAVSQMPEIRKAILKTRMRLPVIETGGASQYDWSLRYNSPCQCPRCRAGFVREGQRETRCSGRTVRGLSFSTLTWRPDGNVLELLREIGSRYHAGRMEEYYLDSSSIAQDLGL